jgi:hypothetical protein
LAEPRQPIERAGSAQRPARAIQTAACRSGQKTQGNVMPSISRPLTNGQPVMEVYVGLSARQRRDATTLELSISDPVRMVLLLDGGAQTSVLDRKAVTPLGLVPISGQLSVSLKLTPDNHPPMVMLDALPITLGEFGGQGYDGVLGCDALKDCVLSLDVNGFMLAF